MYKAIEQLNQVEKAIVMLYLEDKTYEEMEEILGINQRNLRVKMNRVKDKLRNLTNKHWLWNWTILNKHGNNPEQIKI